MNPVLHDTSNSNIATKVPVEESWTKILQSNFDTVIKDCLVTLLKIIDNILSRPNDPKVRSIRCSNAAFEKKVGRCNGGFDFLYSIGFVPVHSLLQGMPSSRVLQPESIVLTSENESKQLLLRARKILTESAIKELNFDKADLPSLPKREMNPSETRIDSSIIGPSDQTRAAEFNVYKGHSFNVSAAAVGAPDPYAETSNMSITERQLQTLQSKKKELEREMQTKIDPDRGLVAYLPGNGPTSSPTTFFNLGGDGPEGKSDSSLVAARLKRMEEEKIKREEGGFTTKAMRDLEKMKKAKVYSHAQIRINFPDGSYLYAKFLPSEKVSAIRSTVKSSFLSTLALDFDLYVAPPRRLLTDTKSLNAEDLVPAARVNVSWRTGGSPGNGVAGFFIKEELFERRNEPVAVFPDAKPVLQEKRSPSDMGRKDSGSNKEDSLVARMMGKSGSLLGGGLNSKSSDKNTEKKESKPKWFKG